VEGVVTGCRERGADCAQIFVSNPRAWASPSIDEEAASAFRAGWRAASLGPLAVHAPYPLNIAAPDEEFLRRGRSLARDLVRTCDALGVDVLVLHAGSAAGDHPAAARRRAATTLRRAAAEADRVRPVVELMAGTRGAVASNVVEAEALLVQVNDDRVGLCLDTAHLFAAGHAIDTSEGAEALAHELRSLGLDDRVRLIHANDSVFPRGEHRDRHADIGEGTIGLGGFRAFLTQPLFASTPMVLETSGDPERQAADIAFLRRTAALTLRR
jgi:deoxyribonuclease-4